MVELGVVHSQHKLGVELFLGRLWRHLDHDDRHNRKAGILIVPGCVQLCEAIEDLALAHASGTEKQEAGHAAARG
jgi:hypothetical protein